MAANIWSSVLSTDGNLVTNWSLGALAATDVLTFNATSAVNCTFSGNISCAGWNMPGGYTGTIDMNTRTFDCTGNWLFEAAATITPGASLITLTGAAAQTFTSAGKVVFDITVNLTTATSSLTFVGTTSLHTLTASATNTQAISWTEMTMTCSGNLTLDGSGTLNCGNGITATGASSNVHFGSGLGAVTATSCVLTMNTVTAGVIDVNKPAILFGGGLVLSASAMATNSGAATPTFSAATNSLIMGTSSKLTLTENINLRLTGSSTFYSLGVGSSFAGTAAISLGVLGNYSVTLPAITMLGTFVLQDDANCNFAYTLTGAITCNAFSCLSRIAGSTGIFNFNNQPITCGQYRFGTSAASTVTVNESASVINCTTMVASIIGTSTRNMQTSQITCSGSWTFGSNHTITGSAGQSVTFTNTATITSNGKVFPGNKIVNAAGKTITKADALSVAGNLTITAGTLAGAFSTTCAGDVTVSISATFNRLILTKATTRTLTVAAGTTLTLTNLTNTNFNGTVGALTRVRSSVPGTQFTMVIPNAVSLVYYDSQDCIYQGFDVTANDGTSVTRGNNLRYLTFNNVTIVPNTGSTLGGTTFTLTDTGNGFGGVSTVVFGAPAVGLTVTDTQHLTGTTPAGAAGAVNIVVTNGDGEIRTLAAAFTYTVPVAAGRSRGESRCYISSSIGI